MSTDRESLADIISECHGDEPAELRFDIADAILAAGWRGPAGVRAAQAEALREAAREWAEGEWHDVFLTQKVEDDVSAVRAMDGWLTARADALAPTAEPEPGVERCAGCKEPATHRCMWDEWIATCGFPLCDTCTHSKASGCTTHGPAPSAEEAKPGSCGVCGALLPFVGATSCPTCHASDADE